MTQSCARLMHSVRTDNSYTVIVVSDIALPGYGALSKFDLKVARREKLLLKGIVAYIGTSSEFTGMSCIPHCCELTLMISA